MKDDIFNRSKDQIQPFQFDEKVTAVFDDMLNRSIPFYQQMIEATGKILTTFSYPQGQIYDLGSSTGTLLCYLSGLMPSRARYMCGIDSSGPMIKKARQNALQFKTARDLKFIQANIEDHIFDDAAVFILNFTLQFIPPGKRLQLMEKLFAHLKPGGIVIICEKTSFSPDALGENFIDIYYQYKKAHGYSDLEIANKREALENILIPDTIDVHISRLKKIGFTPVSTFFQWFNFAGFLGIKNAQ